MICASAIAKVGPDADARSGPEGKERAIVGPMRRLSCEALGLECGRMVPELSVPMDDPRTDPYLRARSDWLAGNDVIGEGLAR